MDRFLNLLALRRPNKQMVERATIVVSDSGSTRSPDATNTQRRIREDTFFDETTVQLYEPEEILRRMLSTKESIHHPGYMPSKAQTGPSQIGKGQCGAIWALDELVLKVPNADKKGQLWNDCCQHKKVEEAFQQTPWELRSSINVPAWRTWIDPAAHRFWEELQAFFPEGFQHSYGILSARIQPIPYPIAHALVDFLAPKSVVKNTKSFLARPENQDCLIRLYLGRRQARSRSSLFKLRNFDLMVNEMESLGLDTAEYARIMAQALAIMHWKAWIDANDVEFVLGRSPKLKMAPTAAELRTLGPVHPICRDMVKFDVGQTTLGIWLLDFDQCRTFSESNEGLEQLVRAFYWNDPYYPRSVSSDPRDVALWDVFRGAYLEASTCLTDSYMPYGFIEEVVKVGIQRAQGGSMFQ